MNKMVLAILPRDHAEPVLRALVAAGHTATFNDSRGGVLRQAQRMLFIAVDETDLDNVLRLIRDNCQPCQAEDDSPPDHINPHLTMPVSLGGAVIFVWNLDRFEIY